MIDATGIEQEVDYRSHFLSFVYHKKQKKDTSITGSLPAVFEFVVSSRIN
jgi:hypothetical protein